MSPEQFESVKRYVGFTSESSRALGAFHGVAAPHLGAIVDDFYTAIQRHPDAAASITGGAAQVERLKASLIQWLGDVLSGPHDDAFLEAHSRIGRVHVRIDLPQEFMFTAMNRIRGQLLAVAARAPMAVDEHVGVSSAVNQILDIELAIMLDTYREDLVDKMRARERLATIGQMSATVAHELRNPLGTIESSLFLMRKRFEKLGMEDSVIQKHHAKIAGQVAECGATISGLLDLARDRPLRPKSVSVRPFVDTVSAALSIPDGVRLTTSIAEDLTIWCDPDQLKRALGNLVRNAVQAVGGRGSVHIDAAATNAFGDITVSDDGPGIAEELRSKIFDVLFTTKASGTGLGLALARRICEAHGGTLQLVPSERGARFLMRIPLYATS